MPHSIADVEEIGRASSGEECGSVLAARLSVWLPSAPARTNFAGWPTALSTAHVTPEPEPTGSGSARLTPFASPLPVFFTSTVNPTSSPAFTREAYAVFVIVTFAGLQTSSALAGFGLFAFVVVNVAVLS